MSLERKRDAITEGLLGSWCGDGFCFSAEGRRGGVAARATGLRRRAGRARSAAGSGILAAWNTGWEGEPAVKVGVGLPNGGCDVDAVELVRLAVGVEEMGLDSVWVVDRWLRPHQPVTMPGVPVPVTMPAEYYREVYDPLELLAHLAALTQRIDLGTSAINVLYQPPVLLARRLATVDRLSAGRLVAGVTSGWMDQEFAVAGVPQQRMGDGFDDHLAAMRAVWAMDPVEYAGTHYAIPRSDIGPKPGRPIPLIVGYNTTAGLRRAARIGDGLHPYRNDLDQLRSDLTAWSAAGEALGRDVSGLQVVLRVAADPDAKRDSASMSFMGPVDRWGDDLATIDELGVDHVLLQLPPETSADETLDIMGKLP
jgi:probable F420-dependent oxidoreductase